jgi:hypothetical protein
MVVLRLGSRLANTSGSRGFRLRLLNRYQGNGSNAIGKSNLAKLQQQSSLLQNQSAPFTRQTVTGTVEYYRKLLSSTYSLGLVYRLMTLLYNLYKKYQPNTSILSCALRSTGSFRAAAGCPPRQTPYPGPLRQSLHPAVRSFPSRSLPKPESGQG